MRLASLFSMFSLGLLAQQTVTTTGGTANTVAKFSGAHTIVNSAITETSGHVGIGTAPTTAKLAVSGLISTSGGVKFPDGTTQVTAQAVGPQGPAGAPGATGPQGPAGNGIQTPGQENIAFGLDALQNVTTGSLNIAIGDYALQAVTTNGANTAVGYSTLMYNTGPGNSAFGLSALTQNTSGQNNTAVGTTALTNNKTGSSNTAVGIAAMENGNGNNNTGIGADALFFVTGNSNTALGYVAGELVTTGSSNIFLGYEAGLSIVTGSNNIDIGSKAPGDESGVIRLGAAGVQNSAFIAGISGVNVASGVGVVIDSNGQLGALTSSRRYKDDIADIGNASDSLMRLRPVTFRYKNQTEGKEYGLIAEEVAAVYPDTVVYKDGQPEAVQYHKINAMLLNEVQKQHAEIDDMKRRVADLETLIRSLPATQTGSTR